MPSIYPEFVCLGQLEVPWRWINAKSPALGEWLKESRQKIELGQKIDLLAKLPPSVISVHTQTEYLAAKQYSALCGLLNHNASVIALHGGDQQSKNKTHLLAKSMAGRFSSIEDIEGKRSALIPQKAWGCKKRSGWLSARHDVCDEMLHRRTRHANGRHKARRGEVAKLRQATKYPLVLQAANDYLTVPYSSNLKTFFLALKSNPETSAYRRDLLYRFFSVLKIHIDVQAATLVEASVLYQREMRHSCRPISHRKLIRTTLLVKGLEYDHAVILHADSLDAKDLYVAITRGAKSLTIIVTGRHLPA